MVREVNPEAGTFAFPAPESEGNYYQSGMTLRDYFAAQAMSAMLVGYYSTHPSDRELWSVIASAAYEQADSMLSERGE